MFSFSTVYMAIIASNILIILLTLCFRNKKIMVNAGYRLLAVFVVLTLIRFALPFELPFTKTVLLPEWISSVLLWVRHPWFYIIEYEFCLWTVLQIIWLIGFIVKLVFYLRKQSKARYHILSHMWDANTNRRYQSVLDTICKDLGKKNSFCIAEVMGIKSPLLYGIRKPHILLPLGSKLTDEDLYYIMLHEASHHFHHDLVIKLLVHIVDMIYWWNPFCRTLVKQTNIILEMRIDDTVTLSDRYTIKNYMQCLTQLAEKATEECPISSAVSIALLTVEDTDTDDDEDTDMTKRFEMLYAADERKKCSFNLVLLLSVISIYFLSYSFILEAHYALPEVEETTMAPSEDSFYAILKEDNTYDIYYGDVLLENTDSLEYHPGIQVYTEKEYFDETP